MPIFSNLKIIDGLSDHNAIMCDLMLDKPHNTTKVILKRHINAIDDAKFCDDIAASDLFFSAPKPDIATKVDRYNSILKTLLDKHAPCKKATIKIRPNCLWYTDAIHTEKQKRRHLERVWRRSQLDSDRRLYQEQKQKVNHMMTTAKSNYYRELFQENSKDQKQLFKLTDRLLHRGRVSPLPESHNDEKLANAFCCFFTDKIQKIRCRFQHMTDDLSRGEEILPTQRLSSFQQVTDDDVTIILKKSSSKSCELDPIPVSLFNKCSSLLIPVFTDIINDSLLYGIVPDVMKVAQVRPLLKKSSLNKDEMKNYRPVSNLSLLSKTLERVVLMQLSSFLTENNLYDQNQSAFRANHSVETATLKIQNDLLRAMDNRKISLLVLLDLSAAFDTVDHTTLFNRLKSCIGINGVAFDWFKSYLNNRSQFVRINEATSSTVALDFGLPQGSVLGPVLFSLYITPLGKIIQQHGISYHCYADDTQLYLSADPEQQQVNLAVRQMEACIDEIRSWMAKNWLKFNDEKTEFIIIGSKQQVSKVHIPSIRVGDSSIIPSSQVRNLGIIFDSSLTMEPHVTSISRSVCLSIRSIGHIRKYLDERTTEILVHAFITSKFDMGNSLLYGINRKQLSRLQRLQNTAARLISLTSKHCHITPVLQDLHWLPISSRIKYKLVLFIYKIIHSSAPEYLIELIYPYTSAYTGLRSSQLMMLHEPRTSTLWGDRSFSAASAKLWNQLPLTLKSASSIATFKKQLKSHLYKQAYS